MSLLELQEMADGTRDTWTYEGSRTIARSTGRISSWNNTVGFNTIPKHLRPVNGYGDEHRTWQQGPVDYITRLKSTGAEIAGNSHGVMYPGATIYNAMMGFRSSTQSAWDATVVKAQNDAAIKVLGKMADAKVNLAVAYAEATKTSNLILDTARRIDRAYRALRKGNFKVVARELNITPSKVHKTWLEYKYGWMPLLMDVKGSAEFFAQQSLTRSPKFTCTAVTEQVQYLAGTDNLGKLGGAGTDWIANYVLERKVTCKIKLDCELSDPHYSELQQLGLTNPALVAWELVPFSFVFDWFIQVGDYLTALSAFHGVTIRRQCRSTIVGEAVRWSAPSKSSADSTYTYYHSGGTRYGVRRYYERVPVTLNPWDLVMPKVNRFDFPKLVTSLALLRGSHRSTVRS